MHDNVRFKNLNRLSSYVNCINLENIYQIDYTLSKEHLTIRLFGNEEEYTTELLHLDKLSNEVLEEKINVICDKLSKYRNI